MNQQIDDSSRYASLLLKLIRPGRQLSERFVVITISCSGSHAILWMGITMFSTLMINDVLPLSLTALAMACRGGAMMTILSGAGLDRSIQQVGMESQA